MNKETQEKPGRTEAMGGLAKGLAIIEMFGAGKDRLSVADAARHASISRAAARRCLLTLAELGYVELDGRYFKPLARLRRLGGDGDPIAQLAERVLPLLAQASSLLDECVSFAVEDGTHVLFVARIDSTRLITTGVRPGTRLPLWLAAAGRVILAQRSNEEVARYLAAASLEPRTPKTICDPSILREQVAKVRMEGFSYNDEELELGIRALAVPVKGIGAYRGAITVTALTARHSREELYDKCAGILRETADRVGRIVRAETTSSAQSHND